MQPAGQPHNNSQLPTSNSQGKPFEHGVKRCQQARWWGFHLVVRAVSLGSWWLGVGSCRRVFRPPDPQSRREEHQRQTRRRVQDPASSAACEDAGQRSSARGPHQVPGQRQAHMDEREQQHARHHRRIARHELRDHDQIETGNGWIQEVGQESLLQVAEQRPRRIIDRLNRAGVLRRKGRMERSQRQPQQVEPSSDAQRGPQGRPVSQGQRQPERGNQTVDDRPAIHTGCGLDARPDSSADAVAKHHGSGRPGSQNERHRDGEKAPERHVTYSTHGMAQLRQPVRASSTSSAAARWARAQGRVNSHW
jgi:hypothetical protein